MSEYITPQGITIPEVSDLITDLATSQTGNVSPLLDTSPDSPLGELNGIVADALRDAWEVVEIAYQGTDPNDAEGYQLESDCAITGTIRQGATRSRFVGGNGLLLTLAAHTAIPDTSIFSSPDGTVVFNATSALASADVPSDGSYRIDAECSVLGPVSVGPGVITTIVTPVSGLTAVTNTAPPEVGTNEDTDTQLRIRRETELRALGACTNSALVAALLAYTDDNDEHPILKALVFENQTDATANGLPPHSFEALVWDGSNATVSNDTIAQIVLDNEPLGISAQGQTFGDAADVYGTIYNIRFSRPNIVNNALKITITKNAKTYVGDTALKAALAAKFLTMVGLGVPILWTDYIEAAKEVTGVLNVTNLQIGTAPSTYNATYTDFIQGTRDIGLLALTDIHVTSS